MEVRVAVEFGLQTSNQKSSLRAGSNPALGGSFSFLKCAIKLIPTAVNIGTALFVWVIKTICDSYVWKTDTLLVFDNARRS